MMRECLIPFPVLESNLILFVSELCQPRMGKAVSAATARLYLAGVYHSQALLGRRVDNGKFRMLAQALRGAAKLTSAVSRAARIPITIDDINRVTPLLPPTFDGRMCLTAMCVAAGAALRSGEIFGQQRSGIDSRTLRLRQL